MKNKMRRPIPVFVAVLTQGSISFQLSDMLIRMVVECIKGKKYEPTIHYSKHTGVDYNRNTIVKEFLKSKCKYLLMIDEDNPPLKNPLELIELGKDIMCLPTLMYKGDQQKLAFNVFKKVKTAGVKGLKTMVYDGVNKLFQADRAGTGCILISRKVLEKIKAPFNTKRGKDGTRLAGEDMEFCRKAQAAGFKVWGHWDYCCSHYKTVDLMAMAEIILKAKSK